MRQVSAALRAAIERGERVIKSELTVDWDDDGVQDLDVLSHKVSQIGMTQTLESSLPAQVQVVPGVAIAELSARLERGNTFRYAVPVAYNSLTTASGIGAASITINRPSTAVVGNVMLLVFFISQDNSSSLATFTPYVDANVSWVPLSIRGDGLTATDPAYARLEGVLFQRRVTADEPAAYTFTLPVSSRHVYVAAAVDVGAAGIMGISDYATKGEDFTNTVTSIATPPVTVDVPNSTIVNFWAASAVAVTGMAFAADGGDVERTEISTASPLVSGYGNLRMSVTTADNVPQGRYVKLVTVSGASPITASLGFSVVLAPKLAGDEAQHAAWTFSEMNPNSPYAGKQRLHRRTKWNLYFATDSGFESVPMFTGLSSAPGASSRGRTASIEALDNRETLRATNKGVVAIAESPIVSDTYTNRVNYPGLDATWIISRLLVYSQQRWSQRGAFTFDSQSPLLTRLGYFANPLAERNAYFWMPAHGSLTPFEGQMIYAYTQLGLALKRRVKFAVGPFVAATEPLGAGDVIYGGWYGTQQRFIWQNSTSQLGGRISFWVKRGQSTSSMELRLLDDVLAAATYSAWIEMSTAGALTFRVELPSFSRTIAGPSVAADGAWHFVGVHFDSVTGSVVFRVDTTNTTVAMTGWLGSVMSVTNYNAVSMVLSSGTQIAEVQVSGTYSFSSQSIGIASTAAWPNENFVPTAFIDKSENELDCVPFIDENDDVFQIISEVAGAEFAAFYFDADGYPHYRTSRSDVNTTGQTIQKIVTARHTIQDIEYQSGVMQIANVVAVAYSPFVAHLDEVAFSVSGLVKVPTGQQLAIDTQLDGPILAIGAATYAANIQPDGGGLDLTPVVTVTVLSRGAYGMQILITNLSSVDAWMVDTSGQPTLSVVASWFGPSTNSVSPVVRVDIDSIRKYGEQPLSSVGPTPWRQRVEASESLAQKLISDLCEAHPVITRLTIKGDPTLEFGDRVKITDVNGLGVNGSYRITGKDPMYTAGEGFTQELVVRDSADVAYWDTNYWDDGTVWG